MELHLLPLDSPILALLLALLLASLLAHGLPHLQLHLLELDGSERGARRSVMQAQEHPVEYGGGE